MYGEPRGVVVSPRIVEAPFIRVGREIVEKRETRDESAPDMSYTGLYARQTVDSAVGGEVELTQIPSSVPEPPIGGPITQASADEPGSTVSQSKQFKWTMVFLLLGGIPSMLSVYVIAWVDDTKDGCTYAKLTGGPMYSLSLTCCSATMLLFMMLSRFYIASSKGYWVRGLLYKRKDAETDFATHVLETRLRVVCFLLLVVWMLSSSWAASFRTNIETCHTGGVYTFLVNMPVVFSTLCLLTECFGRFHSGAWTIGSGDNKNPPPSTVQARTGKLIILFIALVTWVVVVLRQRYLFDSDARNSCAALGVVGFTLFPLLVFSTAVYAFVLASSFLVSNAHAFSGLVLSLCGSGYTVFAVLYVFITKSSKARSCDSRPAVELLDWLILVFAGLVTVLGIRTWNTDKYYEYLSLKKLEEERPVYIDEAARKIEVLQLRF